MVFSNEDHFGLLAQLVVQGSLKAEVPSSILGQPRKGELRVRVPSNAAKAGVGSSMVEHPQILRVHSTSGQCKELLPPRLQDRGLLDPWNRKG